MLTSILLNLRLKIVGAFSCLVVHYDFTNVNFQILKHVTSIFANAAIENSCTWFFFPPIGHPWEGQFECIHRRRSCCKWLATGTPARPQNGCTCRLIDFSVAAHYWYDCGMHKKFMPGMVMHFQITRTPQHSNVNLFRHIVYVIWRQGVASTKQLPPTTTREWYMRINFHITTIVNECYLASMWLLTRVWIDYSLLGWVYWPERRVCFTWST